jgi:hypothetical protein
MTDVPPSHPDPDGRTDPDAPELRPMAERLERERPIPRPAFRSELRRRLFFTPAPSRGRVRTLIAVYATSGAALLLVAAIGVGGGGPLAA